MLVSVVGGVALATAFAVIALELGTFASDPSPGTFAAAIALGVVYGILFGVLAGVVVGVLNGLFIGGLFSAGLPPAAVSRVSRLASPLLTGGSIALVSWGWLLNDVSLEWEGWLIFLALPAVVGGIAAEVALRRVAPLRRLFA